MAHFKERICKITNDNLDKVKNKIEKDGDTHMQILEENNNYSVVIFKKPKFVEANKYRERVMCCAGNVNAGKSSILGVLVTGEKDDGDGKSRKVVMNHAHEKNTGRTSSVGRHILGFDSNNNLINHTIYKNKRKITWESIIEKKPTKVVNLVDLCGHEKYLKTTVYAVSGNRPDYAMVIVAANDGLMKMTYEHLALLVQFNIPFFFVITKIDMMEKAKEKLENTMSEIKAFLKRPGVKKFAFHVKNHYDLANVRGHKTGVGYLRKVVPIFQVSSVTGQNMDLLQHFIGLCPRFKKTDRTPEIISEKNTRAVISESFKVNGIGTVVLCEIMGGTLYKNQTVYLGPIDSACSYMKTKIKSIQRRCYPVQLGDVGQTVTCAIQNIPYSLIRTGLILCSKEISEDFNKRGCWEFETDVRVISSHTLTIYPGYEPVVNINMVRQACRVQNLFKINKDGDRISTDLLRNKDIGIIRFRFVYRPEHIMIGSIMIAREGRLRISGIVNRVIHLEESEK